MANTTKKRISKRKQAAVAVVVLVGSAFACFVFYNYVYVPFLKPEPQNPELLWEGTITQKVEDFEIDRDVYKLEINGTVWKYVDQIQFDKYGVGVYVYCVKLQDGVIFLSNQFPVFL